MRNNVKRISIDVLVDILGGILLTIASGKLPNDRRIRCGLDLLPFAWFAGRYDDSDFEYSNCYLLL